MTISRPVFATFEKHCETLSDNYCFSFCAFALADVSIFILWVDYRTPIHLRWKGATQPTTTKRKFNQPTAGAGRRSGGKEGIWEWIEPDALWHRGTALCAGQNGPGKGRGSVKDVIYNYITSNEFAMHVRAVVDLYSGMKEELEAEKRAMLRIWNRRDRHGLSEFDAGAKDYMALPMGAGWLATWENMTAMYGAIEGLVGRKALPGIEPLSLEAMAAEEPESQCFIVVYRRIRYIYSASAIPMFIGTYPT